MSPGASLNTTPKITVLYDNCSHHSNLQEGFGFSCFIEWGNRRILFDTGGDERAIFQNMGKLGISLDTVTHLFFSHNHWDHTAAIGKITKQIPKSAVVYIPDPFSAALEKQLPTDIQVQKIKHYQAIDQEIYSLVLKGRSWFSTIHEQALLLNTAKGVIVITGCAHPGIVRITEEAKKLLNRPIYMVLGGFHLHHSWSATSAKVVRKLKELEVEKVAPCHCTGKLAIRQFKDEYGDRFIKTATGTILEDRHFA